MVRSPSATSVGDVVDLISVAVGGGDVSTALAVYGRKNKFFVPSSKNPLSQYVVHVTVNGLRDSCSCEAFNHRIYRPCKHILAMRKSLGI